MFLDKSEDIFFNIFKAVFAIFTLYYYFLSYLCLAHKRKGKNFIFEGANIFH